LALSVGWIKTVYFIRCVSLLSLLYNYSLTPPLVINSTVQRLRSNRTHLTVTNCFRQTAINSDRQTYEQTYMHRYTRR